MSKLLIDTNILVYEIDQDSEFFNQSRQILDHSESELVASSKNLIEFLAVVTRSSGYDLKVNAALEILEEIIQNLKLFIPIKIH
ncbi:MAG: PIN domain-containing protein [Balneolales bacterium]